MIKLELFLLGIRILRSPLGAFDDLKPEKDFRKPLLFLTSLGLITAVLSGILSRFGVDYSNPSNAGGSAQLLAPWIIENYLPILRGPLAILIFALIVEVGYLILAFISSFIIATVAGMLTGEKNEGQRSFLKALKAVCYGMAPGLFFGWVPNPFFLVGIWATLWQSIGINRFFGLNTTRTAATVLVWIVLSGLLHDLATVIWSII